MEYLSIATRHQEAFAAAVDSHAAAIEANPGLGELVYELFQATNLALMQVETVLLGLGAERPGEAP